MMCKALHESRGKFTTLGICCACDGTDDADDGDDDCGSGNSGGDGGAGRKAKYCQAHSANCYVSHRLCMSKEGQIVSTMSFFCVLHPSK